MNREPPSRPLRRAPGAWWISAVLLLVAWSPQRPGGVAAVRTADGAERLESLHRLVHLDELRALRTFFERVDVAETMRGVRRPSGSGGTTVAATLAGLTADWEAPFEFVRGGIAYVPYAGTVRGAMGALESGAANALDQALLLQALLEPRGVSTRLLRGTLSWSDAVLLVLGTTEPEAPGRDDPWPRWVETAADHWWIQAQRDGDWVDLDPAFATATAGRAMGRGGVVQSSVPASLRTAVRFELFRGELSVADAVLDGAVAVGNSVHVSVTSRSQQALRIWDQVEGAMAGPAEQLRRLVAALALARVSSTPVPERPKYIRRFVAERDPGPWIAHLEVPGRVIDVGPFDEADLDSLRLRIEVRAPQAVQVFDAAWGGGGGGRLSVAVAAGRVSSAQLAAMASPLYREITELAAIEQAARDAMRPPIAYADAAESLRQATQEGWARFSRAAPQALAWAVLFGTDGISDRSAVGRVVRQSLRLAAARWRPPAGDSGGYLSVVVDDPITVGYLTGGSSVASLRAAYGLLQSAVLSQILNRLAEQVPETAFDATLQAVGTGRPIESFSSPAMLPQTWSATGRARALESLRLGYRILAPERSDDEGEPGWWQVGVVDGEMTGWVSGRAGSHQGLVAVGTGLRPEALDSVLASLPALHRAARWLADLTGSGPLSLSSAPGAACASAAVAASVMAGGLPDGWPEPAVPALCGMAR